jgi:hypothetical protein
MKPKFTGIKKGYDAIFLGDADENSDVSDNRIRVLNDQGIWKWDYADDTTKSFAGSSPCWLLSLPWYNRDKLKDQLKAMKDYDFGNRRKTIFLGYFK